MFQLSRALGRSFPAGQPCSGRRRAALCVTQRTHQRCSGCPDLQEAGHAAGGGAAAGDGGLLYAWAERRVTLYLEALRSLLPQARNSSKFLPNFFKSTLSSAHRKYNEDLLRLHQLSVLVSGGWRHAEFSAGSPHSPCFRK